MAIQYISIIRLKKIDECLRNRNKVYNLEELISSIRSELMKYDKPVKVSERTIYDDLKFLKDEYGPFNAPIKRSNDKGYFYKENGYSIFNPLIDKDNLEKIQSSLSALRQVANMKGFEDLKDTVLRLEASYNFDEAERIPPVVYLEEGLNIAAQKHIEPLKVSIQKQKVISVTYKPFDKPAYARVISPYFLKEYNNRWFLFGHEHALKEDHYEGITNISLDRIEEIKPSLKPYQQRGDFDLKKYLFDVVGVSVNDKEKLLITFKVYGSRRYYVATKKFHHSQKTVKMSPEFALFSISVIPNRELYSHLLTFGADLEVISPKKVRDVISEKAEAMAKRYG